MEQILGIVLLIVFGFALYKRYKIADEERKLIAKREHLLIDALNKYLKGE